MVELGFFRLNPDVIIPSYATQHSCCFDLRYCPTNLVVTGYDSNNQPFQRYIDDEDKSFHVNPGDRTLVPTGLVFRIQTGFFSVSGEEYSIRLHPRSGLSLKKGLVLANAEGLIDYDYQKEIFVLLTNISNLTHRVEYQERICQAEVVKTSKPAFVELVTHPDDVADRSGGFGSTGR